MANLQFFVNNNIVDYFDSSDFSIKVNKKIIDNEDPSSRSGTFTYTIKIPLTSNNINIFNFISEDSSVDKFNSTLKYNAIVYNDDIIIIKGLLYIKEADLLNRTLSCYIISEDINWASLIENKSLQEIKSLNKKPYLSVSTAFNGFSTIIYEIENYHNSNKDTFNLTSDIIFPLIAYQNFYICNIYRDGQYISNQSFSTLNVDGSITLPDAWRQPDDNDSKFYINNKVSNPHITYEDMPPAVFVVNVVRGIFNDIGYTVGGNFFNKLNINKLIIPYTGNTPAPFNWNHLSIIQLQMPITFYIVNDTPPIDFGNPPFDYALPIVPNTLPCYNNTITDIFANGTNDYYYTYKIREAANIPFLVNNIWDCHIFDIWKYFSTNQINMIPIVNASFGFLPNSGVYYPPTDGQYKISFTFDLDVYSDLIFSYTNIANGSPNVNMKLTFAIVKDNFYGEYLFDTILNKDNINDINTFRYTFKNNGDLIAKKDYIVSYNPLVDLCYSKGVNDTVVLDCDFERNQGYRFILVYAPIYGLQTFPFAPSFQRNIQLNSIQMDLKCISSTDDLDISKFLPEISQLDFIKELIILFNLRFDVDNDNKVISFDTFDEYFLPLSTALDINDLTNVDNIKILPIREISNTKYLYVDDTDDFLNKHRKSDDNTSIILNDKYNLVNTELKDIILKNEIFAPTSFKTFNIIYNDVNDANIVLDDSNTPSNNLVRFYRPQIYVRDSISIPFISDSEGYYLVQNKKKDLRYNLVPRLLLLDDSVILNSFLKGLEWSSNTANNITVNKYINCHFSSNVELNTNDINDISSLSWDGEYGLFEKYYRKQNDELNRSHLVEAKVFLTSLLFKELSLKKPVIINGVHYRVNEIVDFDPVIKTLTTLKLTRILI